ncbi:MAG: class I SAM-dependent methyltransferase [Myxococcales bacterium]|nr:class I SAM-dependent methyltransferase [Myxococcales bacterium]
MKVTRPTRASKDQSTPDAAPPAARTERTRRRATRSKAQHPAAAKTYESAVAHGFYLRDAGGLAGKYDNVRRYWEDQITRYALRDSIASLVERKRRTLSRIRVLDLGSGSGQGYEILTSIKRGGGSLAAKEVDVLSSDMLGFYKGVDISPAMIEQARESYKDVPKVEFVVGDLSEGLGEAKEDEPYDVFFSSYGSLSHLDDSQMRRLVADVVANSRGPCLFVADLVGRYSVEWPCYWREGEAMRDYSMSYLYSEDVRARVEPDHFPLRYWSAAEFEAFMESAVDAAGGVIEGRRIRDRSILVGRHMDTREYNPHARSIRAAVNSLHEFYQRTDLESLIFDYAPELEAPELNAFFESFQMAWNAVVYAAIDALDDWSNKDRLREPPPEEYPEPVRVAIRTIRDVVRHVEWFRMGDPRANIVEPQLGYILRNLEMDFQQGLGAGHGLMAIYAIRGA